MSCKRAIVLGTAAVLVLCFVRLVPSQPARSRIIEGVRIDTEGGATVIQVAFTFPVRYVKHFPLQSGDELQVYFRPVSVSRVDASFLLKREAARLAAADRGELVDVTYEGPSSGGPLVTLRFRRSVQFKVRQGEDFRSLTVSVAKPDGSMKPPAVSDPAGANE